MLAQNRSGWTLLEYLKIQESELAPFVMKADDEMERIMLWDLKQDIGYVDECDLKIVELSCM